MKIYRLSFYFLVLSLFQLLAHRSIAQKDILVIVAHPNLTDCKVNKTILQQQSRMGRITINNLYEKFPVWNIDVANEQELLLDHD